MWTANPYTKKDTVQLCHPKEAHLEGNTEEMDDYIRLYKESRGFGYSKEPSESLHLVNVVISRINKDTVGTEEMNMS